MAESTPADRIRNGLSKLGLKPQDLAVACGVTHQAMSVYLSNKDPKRQGRKHWGVIAEILKTSREWIATGTGVAPTWIAPASNAAQQEPPSYIQGILEELRALRAEVSALRRDLTRQQQPARERRDERTETRDSADIFIRGAARRQAATDERLN